MCCVFFSFFLSSTFFLTLYMFFATGMTFLQNQKIIKNLDLPVPYSRREKLCFYAVCHGDCFLYRKWVRRVTHTPFAMSKTSVFPYDYVLQIRTRLQSRDNVCFFAE